MGVCAYVKPDSNRCKAQPMKGESWCYAHHPDLSEKRSTNGRRGGKRGGRGRPVSELASIKRQLQDLADAVLAGEVKRAEAAVVGQLLNILLRAVELGRKVEEQQELLERIEALEQAEGGYKWEV
jgi:hypothetical protein